MSNWAGSDPNRKWSAQYPTSGSSYQDPSSNPGHGSDDAVFGWLVAIVLIVILGISLVIGLTITAIRGDSNQQSSSWVGTWRNNPVNAYAMKGAFSLRLANGRIGGTVTYTAGDSASSCTATLSQVSANPNVLVLQETGCGHHGQWTLTLVSARVISATSSEAPESSVQLFGQQDSGVG